MYTILNGVLPVTLCLELFLENYTWANATSYYLGFSPWMLWIKLPKVLFRDFVWPLICGWAVLLNIKKE